MDMISTLPPSIIEDILCRVPIQDAARTSVLAKDWRYHWTRIPKLVFEEYAFSFGDGLEETFSYNDTQNQRKETIKRGKLLYAIDQVLSKHEGPIDEFTLQMRADKTCVDIDHIFSYLSRKYTVKKLTLNIGIGLYRLPYRLPSSVFSFDHLTDLHLSSCDLDHEPPFNGFYSLTNLFIEYVSITKSALLHLLSNCPSLKSLTLNMYPRVFQGAEDFTVTNLFECIPMVENLSISIRTIESFAQDGVPPVLPTALIHLKYINFHKMSFMNKYGLPFLLCLIRSSPNLEKLKLKQMLDCPWLDQSEEVSFTPEDYSDIWLERLNVLEIFISRFKEDELPFVKLILAKSPVLKKVWISLGVTRIEDEVSHVSGILSSAQRASPLVEFVVEKYYY